MNEYLYKKLILRGKAITFIDWANVYGWTKSLKREIDPQKIFSYLKTYSQINDIRFYFGQDSHPKSLSFLKNIQETGFTLVSKPVKYILLYQINGQNFFRRKCDFDMEICIDVHRALQRGYESFIFFSGDGDFEPMYKMLIEKRKKVIVIFAQGHLGKEIHQMKNGIYKKSIFGLMEFFK